MAVEALLAHLTELAVLSPVAMAGMWLSAMLAAAVAVPVRSS